MKGASGGRGPDDAEAETPAPAPAPAATLYRVRKTWSDSKTQKGAFKVLANAKKCADANPGYSVFNADGNVVYTPVKEDRIYIVVKGDTLWGIAKALLGSGARYTEIVELNGLKTPVIYSGQQLRIPQK